MKAEIILYLLRILPKNLLSWLVGRVLSVRLPRPLNRVVLHLFIRKFKINIRESEHPPRHYRSLSEFFVRGLRAGARPIGVSACVSPSDGRITEYGPIQAGTLLQAKGIRYRLQDLTVDESLCRGFENGSFVTIYLAPHNYHHVHSPVRGTIERFFAIGGTLWPVNDASVRHVRGLFVVNERVIVPIDTEFGRVAVVFVGATNVGSIRLAFTDFISNCLFRRPRAGELRIGNLPAPIAVEKGARLGAFHFGSTVILLLPEGFPLGELREGVVKMGADLGAVS